MNHYTLKAKDIQTLRTNEESMRKEDLFVYNHTEVERISSQNLTYEAVKQETENTFGPDLIPALWSSEDIPSSHGNICEHDGKDFVDRMEYTVDKYLVPVGNK